MKKTAKKTARKKVSKKTANRGKAAPAERKAGSAAAKADTKAGPAYDPRWLDKLRVIDYCEEGERKGTIRKMQISLSQLDEQMYEAHTVQIKGDAVRDREKGIKQDFANIAVGIALKIIKENPAATATMLADMFADAKKAVDEHVKSYLKGKLGKEKVSLPRAWIQSGSDIKGALVEGVDFDQNPTYSKVKKEKVKLKAEARRGGDVNTMQDVIDEIRAIHQVATKADPALDETAIKSIEDYMLKTLKRTLKTTRTTVENRVSKAQTAAKTTKKKAKKKATKKKAKTTKQANAAIAKAHPRAKAPTAKAA